jgi:nucleotide-binding universal stress UspA family protein/rhodanese-related sulfurtransferase
MFGLFKKWFSGNQAPVSLYRNAKIVDVRSPGEFDASHVDGAVNIPLEQLSGRIQQLEGSEQIVLYCRSGNRSSHAKRILSEAGINKVIDGGGLQDIAQLLGAAGINNSFVTADIPEVTPVEVEAKDDEIIKVLIPTDFSQQADFAGIMAEKLSSGLNVEIHYIHVMEVPETVTLDDNGKILTCGEIDPDYLISEKQKALVSLEEVRSKHESEVFTHFAMGKLTDTISIFATQQRFDLIIMGTKGAWGLKERISGSESQHVARKSEVPLLTLMCDRSDLVLKDVLVVHDYHEGNSAEIPLLKKFKDVFKIQVHQLYVDTSEKGTNEEVLKIMESYAQKHQMTDCVNHIVPAPDVERGVLTFLEKQDADMIFIGTHGKGSLFHVSAAEKLVNHLFKPIITYHL